MLPALEIARWSWHISRYCSLLWMEAPAAMHNHCPPAPPTTSHPQAAARQWVPARRLFKRALEAEPGHVAALQAWGRLEAAAGEGRILGLWAHLGGRQACGSIVACAVPAAWRLPALRTWCTQGVHSFYPSRCAGKLKQARRLFQDALRHEPANTHVLQALAVAEAR